MVLQQEPNPRKQEHQVKHNKKGLDYVRMLNTSISFLPQISKHGWKEKIANK